MAIGNKSAVLDASMAHWYKLWLLHTRHPNLRISYFHEIDTKEKAYWLGFLYADGSLTRNRKGATYIRLELKRSDEYIIDKFCRCLGLDKSKKKYRIHEYTRSVEIRFACKLMAIDLIRLGLTFRKSRIIEYPALPSRDMELAFLLGYYDGDGKRNSPEITSGSKRFLEQVKYRFNLRYKLRTEVYDKKIYDRRIRGTEHRLWLGVDLFNEMLDNYADSMTRKRGYGIHRSQ